MNFVGIVFSLIPLPWILKSASVIAGLKMLRIEQKVSNDASKEFEPRLSSPIHMPTLSLLNLSGSSATKRASSSPKLWS